MVTLELITPATAVTYKSLRLGALLDAPYAFGSTHAKEALLSDEGWQSRAARYDGKRAVGFLAVDGPLACGLAAGFLDREDPAKAHLVSMWVAPDHRGRGVGRLLVGAVSDWARSVRVRALYLTVTSNNAAATRFYDTLGFAKTGRVEPYSNDPSLAVHEMVREIALGGGPTAR